MPCIPITFGRVIRIRNYLVFGRAAICINYSLAPLPPATVPGQKSVSTLKITRIPDASFHPTHNNYETTWNTPAFWPRIAHICALRDAGFSYPEISRREGIIVPTCKSTFKKQNRRVSYITAP
jgi:hypothetical protein